MGKLLKSIQLKDIMINPVKYFELGVKIDTRSYNVETFVSDFSKVTTNSKCHNWDRISFP